MRWCLSELSLRGRRALFLSKLALSPRQCGKHRHNSLIVRAYQLDDISLRNRKFHLALCRPTGAITDLKDEAMGPWRKYRFFRQKSVLAHNSIWTKFRGYINFKQAIKHLKRVGNDSCARRGLERYFNSHRGRYGPNCRLGRNYRNRRFPSCCIECCCRDGQQRDRESNTPPHALSPRA